MAILLTQVNVTRLPPARHGGPHGRDQPPAAVATPGSGLAGTGTRTGVSPNLLAVQRKPSLSQALGHRLAVTLGLVRVAGRSGPSCRPQGGARERGEDLLLCVGVCPRDPGDPGSPTPLQAGGSSSCLAARLLSVFYLFFPACLPSGVGWGRLPKPLWVGEGVEHRAELAWGLAVPLRAPPLSPSQDPVCQRAADEVPENSAPLSAQAPLRAP